MNLSDVYSAKRIAIVHKEVASNKIPYLGKALFPFQKKAGLDLSWIKTSKGLPVSLKPSAFDTVSTIRSREGISIEETEMAYFKESMLVKEKDEQEILRVQESSDPYAKDVINHIFDDAETLIAGAEVVPERMVWQLLAPQTNGKPQISLSADGATYAYDYDPTGAWKTSNYTALSGTSVWSDTTHSDPIADLDTMAENIETLTGERPTLLVISAQTMRYLKQNDKVKNYILAQNQTATVVVTDARVKELIKNELKMDTVVYTKQFKDETGTAQKFYPDGFASLLPNRALGNTWFGTTPEERSKQKNAEFDCELVEEGIAVAVTQTHDPEHTKTTASEICLPSYESMDYVGVIKVY